MEIIGGIVTLVVIGLALWLSRSSYRELRREQHSLWNEVAEALGIGTRSSTIGPLGTEGATGQIDGMAVQVLRPSTLTSFAGDRVQYTVNWGPARAKPVLRIESFDSVSYTTMPGVPIDGSRLRLVWGTIDEFSAWRTPERDAALSTLLVDGAGRATQRRLIATEHSLRLELPWRERTVDELVITTQRLVEIARVLSGSPTELAEPDRHPLDLVADDLATRSHPELAVMPVDALPPSEVRDADVPGADVPPLLAPEPKATSTEIADGDDDLVPFTVERAVAELLDRSLMTHEATAHFDTHHRGRPVEWSGTVTALRRFTSDPDFDGDGVRATVHVLSIDDSRLVTDQVHAVVQLPSDASVIIDDHIEFGGTLVRVDRTMRNLYVAGATLT